MRFLHISGTWSPPIPQQKQSLLSNQLIETIEFMHGFNNGSDTWIVPTGKLVKANK